MNPYKGLKILLVLMILLLTGSLGYLLTLYDQHDKILPEKMPLLDSLEPTDVDSIQIVLGSFLGNETRSYYGDSLPNELNILWKYEIGGGITNPTGKKEEEWKGAGWTGQPLIIEENGHPYLIQGCYDHTLKKIDAINGNLVWEYLFDDVLKGTGTIWMNPNPHDPLNRILILQGARLGLNNTLYQDTIPSYRAISYLTGKEVWRLNVKKGPSFSRDVDGSAIIINDTAYIGLENGYLSVFNPGETDLLNSPKGKFKSLLAEYPLFNENDQLKHGGELVIESSPCKLGNHLYLTTGSGHVYGYNLQTRTVDWDLYLGADMNGTPVVTADSCLLVTLEKEFIAGQGGVMKIDPQKSPAESVVWYFPTGDQVFANWEGGIVGSPSINDHYSGTLKKGLACITALDGNLYLLDHTQTHDSIKVKGPDSIHDYPTPVVLDQQLIGSSISTPIFVGNKICAASYSKICIFEISEHYQLQLLAMFKGVFEATPTAYHGMVFIAAKNGFLYCLGKNS